MLKIAHRGYSAKYKDNSIDAFIGAIEEGFDMIELDIQLCKGDEIVIFHDTMIHDKEIIDMTLTELEELSIIPLKTFFTLVPVLSIGRDVVGVGGAPEAAEAPPIPSDIVVD